MIFHSFSHFLRNPYCILRDIFYEGAIMINILNKTLRKKTEVFDFFRKQFAKCDKEKILVVGINDKRVTLLADVSFNNKYDGADFHMNDTVEMLVKNGCNKFIIAHNHPNNYPLPSDIDRNMTKKLIKLGKEKKCRLLEHYVYSDIVYWPIMKDTLKIFEEL